MPVHNNKVLPTYVKIAIAAIDAQLTETVDEEDESDE
jgi:hypothetical protein